MCRPKIHQHWLGRRKRVSQASGVKIESYDVNKKQPSATLGDTGVIQSHITSS